MAISLAAGLSAVGAIAKNKAPALAINLYPRNGFAVENIAAGSFRAVIADNAGQLPDKVDSSITKLAREAFIAEPITPEAVAILAFGRTDQNKREIMNKAIMLSRRQPLVTAWMIADSGTRQDAPALLKHYDSMLRTSASASSMIIPVMTKALSNDSFVRPFANMLAQQPPWAPRFWDAVVSTPDSLGNAAQLREMLYKPTENESMYRDANLIRALVDHQQFETAEVLYHLLAERKEAGSFITNGSFETEPEYPPIDWQLFSTGEYGAVVTNGKLELSAIYNSGGLFARQLVKLPPRTVTMQVNPDGIISNNAQIFISLTCAQAMDDAPQVIRIPLKRKIEKLQIDNSQSGCSFYWLDVEGRASGNAEGFDLAIDSISLQ